MRTTLIALLLAASCTGSTEISRSDDRSYAQRMDDAQEHDRRAVRHERAASRADLARGPTAFDCGDPVLNDQVTTGGLRVTTWQPCFDLAEEAAVEHRQAAERERELAKRDRRTAAALVRAEVDACNGIPEAERAHSVFAHKSAIANVIPHREAGQIRGVWVELKPVQGLTADWVRRDIACQRARWAALGPSRVSPDDPTLIPGAEVQVFDRGDHVDVLIKTDNAQDGELAVSRLRPTGA